MRMGDKLDADNNQCLLPLKEIMCGLIFDKLAEVDTLRRLNGKVSMDYRGTSDFAKIAQIVSQYKNKYSKDLAEIKSNHGSLTELKERLTGCILHIYGQIEENCDLVAEKEKIIVLDYLVTLRQLVSLLQTHDM